MEEQEWIKILERALVREKSARKMAETLLEQKATELYKLSETLKQTNNRLESLLQKKTSELEGVFVNIVDAYILIDLSGNIMEMNDAAIELLGYNCNEEPFNLMGLLEKHQIKNTLKAFKKLYQSGFYKNYIAEITTKKGIKKIVQLNASIIYNGKGKPIGAQGIVRDITHDMWVKNLMFEQKKQLDIVIENSPLGIILTDIKATDIVLTNEAFRRMLGYTENELKKVNIRHLVYLDDMGFMADQIKLLRSGEKNKLAVEMRYITKEGKIIWAKMYISAVKDFKEELKYLVATIEDISQDKENQEKLIESEARLSSLILNLQTGILLEDNNCKVRLSNKKFCDLFGIDDKPEALIGLECLIAAEQSKILFKDPEDFIGRVRDLLENNTLVRNEILELADGRFFNRCYIPIFHNGICKGRLWTYEDITLQRNYELNLNNLKEKFSAIIENMNLGLIEVDNEDKVLYVNQSFCKISGYTRKELYGQKAKDLLLSPNYKQEIIKRNDKRLMGVSDSYEIEAVHKSGEKRHWLISGAPNYDENGKVIGSIGIHLDITQQKNLELQKEQLLKNLGKQNEQLNEFAHIVSHDLKSPLQGISALISWTKEDFKEVLGDEGLKNLNMIDGKVEKMDNLIENILKYSSIENGGLEREKIDVASLVQDIISLIHVPPHITISPTSTLPNIKADKTRIQQVFQNLISNAIHYNDKSIGNIEIGSIDDMKYYIFYVKDNGMGISKEYHHKIFKIFNTLSNDQKSTGIGLSIVKKIVELHNGNIWVESELGVGATFYFSIKK